MPWLGEIQRIRIPSLAAFGVYLAALWQFWGLFTNRWIGRLAFAALLGSAYVLDYFSIGRGYGMATAFALLATAAALQTSDDRPGWGCVAVWSGALAALSNLSLLYYYNAVLLIVLFLLRRQSLAYLFAPRVERIGRRRQLSAETHHHGAIKRRGVLVGRHTFRGRHGPLAGQIRSVPRQPFLSVAINPDGDRPRAGGHRPGSGGNHLADLAAASSRSIVAFCTLIVVGQIYAGHYLAHVQFPVERAAMYFIPLFVLQIAYVADGTPLRWLRLGLSGLLVAYTVTAAWSLNLTHMAICKTMADIPALIQDLAHAHEKNGHPVELCMSDGAKWQVWYYAELAAKVPENERLQEFAMFRANRLAVSLRDALWTPDRRGSDVHRHDHASVPLGDDYPPAWFPHDTVLVREYPVSHWRLYSKIGEAARATRTSCGWRPTLPMGTPAWEML